MEDADKRSKEGRGKKKQKVHLLLMSSLGSLAPLTSAFVTPPPPSFASFPPFFVTLLTPCAPSFASSLPPHRRPSHTLFSVSPLPQVVSFALPPVPSPPPPFKLLNPTLYSPGPPPLCFCPLHPPLCFPGTGDTPPLLPYSPSPHNPLFFSPVPVLIF